MSNYYTNESKYDEIEVPDHRRFVYSRGSQKKIIKDEIAGNKSNKCEIKASKSKKDSNSSKCMTIVSDISFGQSLLLVTPNRNMNIIVPASDIQFVKTNNDGQKHSVIVTKVKQLDGSWKFRCPAGLLQLNGSYSRCGKFATNISTIKNCFYENHTEEFKNYIVKEDQKAKNQSNDDHPFYPNDNCYHTCLWISNKAACKIKTKKFYYCENHQKNADEYILDRNKWTYNKKVLDNDLIITNTNKIQWNNHDKTPSVPYQLICKWIPTTTMSSEPGVHLSAKVPLDDESDWGNRIRIVEEGNETVNCCVEYHERYGFVVRAIKAIQPEEELCLYSFLCSWMRPIEYLESKVGWLMGEITEDQINSSQAVNWSLLTTMYQNLDSIMAMSGTDAMIFKNIIQLYDSLTAVCRRDILLHRSMRKLQVESVDLVVRNFQTHYKDSLFRYKEYLDAEEENEELNNNDDMDMTDMQKDIQQNDFKQTRPDDNSPMETEGSAIVKCNFEGNVQIKMFVNEIKEQVPPRQLQLNFPTGVDLQEVSKNDLVKLIDGMTIITIKAEYNEIIQQSSSNLITDHTSTDEKIDDDSELSKHLKPLIDADERMITFMVKCFLSKFVIIRTDWRQRLDGEERYTIIPYKLTDDCFRSTLKIRQKSNHYKGWNKQFTYILQSCACVYDEDPNDMVDFICDQIDKLLVQWMKLNNDNNKLMVQVSSSEKTAIDMNIVEHDIATPSGETSSQENISPVSLKKLKPYEPVLVDLTSSPVIVNCSMKRNKAVNESIKQNNKLAWNLCNDNWKNAPFPEKSDPNINEVTANPYKPFYAVTTKKHNPIFSWTRYQYLSVLGDGNCLFNCVCLALYRSHTLAQVAQLRAEVGSFIESDGVWHDGAVEHGSSRNHTYAMSYYFLDNVLYPKLLNYVPVIDEKSLDEWRLLRKVVNIKRGGVKLQYMSCEAAKWISHAYADQVRCVRSSCCQPGDDLMPLYVIAHLYNIGFMIWYNSRPNDQVHDQITPWMFIHRSYYQKAAEYGYPILNILYCPVGSVLVDSKLGIGHYTILTDNQNLFSYFSKDEYDLKPSTEFKGAFKWTPTKTIINIHDSNDVEVQRKRYVLWNNSPNPQPNRWARWWWLHNANAGVISYINSKNTRCALQLMKAIQFVEQNPHKPLPKSPKFNEFVY